VIKDPGRPSDLALRSGGRRAGRCGRGVARGGQGQARRLAGAPPCHHPPPLAMRAASFSRGWAPAIGDGCMQARARVRACVRVVKAPGRQRRDNPCAGCAGKGRRQRERKAYSTRGCWVGDWACMCGAVCMGGEKGGQERQRAAQACRRGTTGVDGGAGCAARQPICVVGTRSRLGRPRRASAALRVQPHASVPPH
jgi:hypothetical protein